MAGTGLNELSVCQSWLPDWYCIRRSLQSIKLCSAFGSTFERSTMFSCRRCSWPIDRIVFSRGPKRVVNAICCSSVSRWLGKTSTEYSWNASWIRRNVVSSIGAARSTPSTRAPSTRWMGVMVSAAMRNPPLQRRLYHGPC